MTTRAAIYARVSSERQAGEDRVSIDMQLADCEAYCKEKGYVIFERYVDKEKYRSRGKLVQPSGQRKDRPAYRTMLKAAAADEFDVIVAWKEDRLYRGMYPAMPLSELLDEKGKSFSVELVRETFDPKMLGIKAAMGKIEVDNIRERMLMGRRARLERGEVPGGDQQPYGYTKRDKRLAVDEKEADVVRKIFNWYVAGESNNRIRTRLDGIGVPPRRGKRWAKSTVQRILENDIYAMGRIITTLGDDTFEIPCPSIITMDLWHQAETIRTQNRERNKPRNVKRDYLCNGLVFCVCGWKCYARTSRVNLKRGYKKLYGYYGCPRKDTMREEFPGCARTTGSKKVDDYVWAYVKQVCSNPQVIEAAIYAKLAELEQQRENLGAEIDIVESKLEKIHGERQWVITQARKGRISEQDMEMQLQQLETQTCGYRRELEELQASRTARDQLRALTEWAKQYLKDIQEGIRVLEADLEVITIAERDSLFTQLEAWRFADKYPDDKLTQLKWAVLEEKRRIVRTLISRVVVRIESSGKGRIIQPELALDIPYDTFASQDHGHQSLEYINEAKWRVTSEPRKIATD